MAQSRGQKRNDPADGALNAFGRMLGFAAVAGMAFALLAAVVLLPAWHRLDRARADRDLLAAQVELHEQYIQHEGRLIESIKSDPIQTERLLMEQQNYHYPGEQRVAIPEAPVDPPLLEVLAAQTPRPRPASPLLAAMSRRVQRPRIRRGVLLLSGVMGALAVLMFLPPTTAGKKAA